MKIEAEYTEEDLKQLVLEDLAKKFDIPFNEQDLQIETKSKQNYRSEWETAAFRCKISCNK